LCTCLNSLFDLTEYSDLHDNSFSGTIPASIGALEDLGLVYGFSARREVVRCVDQSSYWWWWWCDRFLHDNRLESPLPPILQEKPKFTVNLRNNSFVRRRHSMLLCSEPHLVDLLTDYSPRCDIDLPSARLVLFAADGSWPVHSLCRTWPLMGLLPLNGAIDCHL